MKSAIQRRQTYASPSPNGKRVLLLCGFGGSIWQTRRLIRVLTKAGYDVTAFDFHKEVLSTGDTMLLPGLVDEMAIIAEQEAAETEEAPLLVGISLGVLISLNILRRSRRFTSVVGITGGDIVTVAQNIYGDKIWPQDATELSKIWQNVNIYSEPSTLAGKRLFFVLPVRDKLIDPDVVRDEVMKQQLAGNDMKLLERKWFGHVGTIIVETIIFPKRILKYIKEIE